jgi:hypothetical protein
MEKNEFKCFCCEQTYEKAWTDDEAREEFKDNYPTDDPDDILVVCDDCYKINFMAH